MTRVNMCSSRVLAASGASPPHRPGATPRRRATRLPAPARTNALHTPAHRQQAFALLRLRRFRQAQPAEPSATREESSEADADDPPRPLKASAQGRRRGRKGSMRRRSRFLRRGGRRRHRPTGPMPARNNRRNRPGQERHPCWKNAHRAHRRRSWSHPRSRRLRRRHRDVRRAS